MAHAIRKAAAGSAPGSAPSTIMCTVHAVGQRAHIAARRDIKSEGITSLPASANATRSPTGNLTSLARMAKPPMNIPRNRMAGQPLFDHGTGKPVSGVAGRLARVVVRMRMHHEGAAANAGLAFGECHRRIEHFGAQCPVG